MRAFEYFEPRDVAAAVALLAEDPERRIVAGGTDLIPQMKRGQTAPPGLVSLAQVPSLHTIEERDGALRIGAMVALGTLERDARVQARYPALHQAVSHVADRTIRRSGTLGGNVCLDTKCIYRDQVQTWPRALPACLSLGGDVCHVVPAGSTCHASLAADTVPVLIALEARAHLVSPAGERVVPVEALHAGDTLQPLALAPGEVLSTIVLPAPPAGARSAYVRFSHRRALDFPVASVAVAVHRGNGRVPSARVVVGAVAPHPVRLSEIERRLQGERLTAALLHECARQAPAEALKLSRSGRIDRFVRPVLAHLVHQALQSTLGGDVPA